MCLDAKRANTNAYQVQFFAEIFHRHFSIQSSKFDSKHFNKVNLFMEENHDYFCSLKDPENYRFDNTDDHELVADINAHILIRLVKSLRKARSQDRIKHCLSQKAPLLDQQLNKSTLLNFQNLFYFG